MKILKGLKNTFWGDEPVKGGSALFVTFIALSCTATIVANILGVKQWPLFGWSVDGHPLTLPVAVIVFPITYILSDVFSDVYGYSASRRATWISFAMNFLSILFFWIADIIPGAEWGTEGLMATHASDAGTAANAFHQILGCDFSSSWGPFGVVVAGLIAYIVGSWIDDLVFEGLRKATAKKYQGEENEKTLPFILRAVVSSFAGELVDSLIFMPLMYVFLGLIGNYSFWSVICICLIQSTFKMVYELCISPLTHLIAVKARKYEKSHNAELKVRED